MGHVERQNQGGHVNLWYVSMRSGIPMRIAARTRGEAVVEAAQHGEVNGALLLNNGTAGQALLLAREALCAARTESAKGRR
jgi:hypothetical protein